MVITTSGSIASFKTPVKQPLKSLKVHFSPIQNGSGDPSPTNVRPITGRTGLEVTRCGKNLYDKSSSGIIEGQYIDSTGAYVSNGSSVWWHITDFISVFGAKSIRYYMIGSSGNAPHCAWYDKNKNLISAWKHYDCMPTKRPDGYVQSVPNDAAFMRMSIGNGSKDTAMIILGDSLISAYEPYSGTTIPVDWSSEAGTLYGGYVDLISGELVKTHAIKSITGTEDWYISNGISGVCAKRPTLIGLSVSSDDYVMPTCDKLKGAAKWATEINECTINQDGNFYFGAPEELSTKEAVNNWIQSIGGFEIVYPITPVTCHLDPIQLETLIGRNNIFSNADTVEATYDLYETAEMKNIRKHIMMQPKRIQVLWNNFLPPMSTTDYRAYSDTRTTLEDTEEVGTVKQTWITQASGFAASTRTIQNTTIQMDHKYYISYMIKPSWDGSGFGIECFGGKIFYNGIINSGEWTRISAIGYGAKDGYGIAYMGNLRTTYNVIVPNESYVLLKSPIYIDLTLMFGEGNEPDLNEFEELCATNGIDLTKSYAQDLTGTSKWWIFKPIIEHSFDGIPVMINNAYLLGGNGYRCNEHYEKDNDYFVTEFFDTGDKNEKSYTFTYIPKPESHAYARWYDSLMQANGSQHYYGLTTDSSAVTRTVSVTGQYVIFSMHKEFAPYAYCYDNTNQRYVFKGSKVT